MIDSQEDLGSLLKQRFLNLVDNALIEAIVKEGKIMEILAGQVIMDFGSYVKMVPLVMSGRIKVIGEYDDGKELFLYYLEEEENCSMSFTYL